MQTIECLNRNDCCGCSSCVQKCPRNAIIMNQNEEGFLYPIIEKSKCIDCGLCSKVCPQLKKVKELAVQYPKAYAVRNKNEKELINSSSGGFFSVIANYIIEKNGTVFGAAYDKDFNVNHIKVKTKEELSLLRGSKYVQSNINNTYKEAEIALQEGQYVLFTGTPCQISGLKSFLMKEYDTLITADLVCHGVPSQKLFNKYIDFLSRKYKSKVIEYNFRSKDLKGWGLVSKVKTADGKIRSFGPDFDPYYSNFLSCLTYRNCCYQCHYTNYNRISDFTMADFWGIEKIHPDFYKEQGNSLVLVNNEKADKIFDDLKSLIEYIPTNLDKAANQNKNLVKPSKKPDRRNMVYDGIDDKNINEFMKKNLKCKITIRKVIKKIFPTKMKRAIKKIIKKLR